MAIEPQFIKSHHISTAYTNEIVDIYLTYYFDGVTPAILVTSEGNKYDQIMVATVNLAAYDINPGEGQVIIKDNNENTGITESLERAGIVRKVDTIHYGPFNSLAWLCDLTAQPA